MIKFGSSFEWAFRRALFSLLLLLVYLLIGSLLLSTVGHLEQSRLVAEACRDQREVQKGMRLDFERNELLNTLWAESLASRSESDWSLVANAKLDTYERLLFSASRTASACPSIPGRSSTHQWELASTFRSLLLLATTAGGGPLTEQPPEQLGPATKVLAGLLALVGIPLLLTHLEHSVTALSALIEANFTESPRWGLALVVISGFVTAALAVDIVLVEKEEDELQRSFLDQLYTVLLAFFTISGAQLRPLPLPLLLPLSLCLCTLSGCLLAALLTGLQRWLAPHEFAFANGFCGQIEKAVSGARLDQQRNSDQLPPKVKEAPRQWKSAEVPVLRFNIGNNDEDDDDDGVDDLLLMNDMTEPNTTANHFGLVGHHHRGNIDTIEEEGELNSQGEPREE